MRFHVAGVGSIGTLLAHHLRLSVDPKHAIVLLHKTEQRMRNASQLDPPISVIADGVTQSSSGYLHELSDKSPPPRPRWTPFAVRKKQAEKRQAAEATRSNSSEHAEPESDYPDQFEDETSADGPIDSLFVATKAHAIVPLMHQLYPRIRPSSTIVLLHNGMGVYERLVRDIFRNRENRPHFILTSNTHAAYTVGGGKVVYSSHRGKGALQFGIVPDARSRDFEVRQTTLSGDRAFSLDAISSPQDSEAIHYSSLRNTVAVLSNLTGLNASWQSYDDIIMAIKRKLVVNAVINPLTAIMNCRNGDIIESPNTYRIARAVCEEAALVFALQYNQRMLDEGRPFALPQTALPKDHYKTSILSRIPHQLRADSLMYEIIRVAKATALNTSSMVQDIRANRPTEIDYLNGYLYRLGRQYNVRMSTNAYLVNMVKLRQDVPIDVVQDLPPRTVDVRDKRAPSAEKLVARAWALVAARKFKRTKFKWRWQMRAITLQRKAREKAMLEKLMGS